MKFFKNHIKMLFGILIAVFGLVAFCLGLSSDYYGEYELSQTYGGDAYTGIQNAAAATANNVYHLGDTITEIYTGTMVALGLGMILGGNLLILNDIAINVEKKKGDK